MTIQPEMKFLCDRCHDEVNISINDQPAQDRNKPPDNWLALWIDTTVAGATHLCANCAGSFKRFMMVDVP
jgi:hypothetical protein